MEKEQRSGSGKVCKVYGDARLSDCLKEVLKYREMQRKGDFYGREQGGAVPAAVKGR